MRLYLVQDGIKDVGCKTFNGKQVFNSNFHLITYDFKTNEGYIDKKGKNHWRLYTQIGQKCGKSRYHVFGNLEQCVDRLKELKGGEDIVICKSSEIEKGNFKKAFNKVINFMRLLIDNLKTIC